MDSKTKIKKLGREQLQAAYQYVGAYLEGLEEQYRYLYLEFSFLFGSLIVSN